MRHVGAEVAANDAVPSGVVFLVEFLLHERSNVLLDVVLLKRLLEYLGSCYGFVSKGCSSQQRSPPSPPQPKEFSTRHQPVRDIYGDASFTRAKISSERDRKSWALCASVGRRRHLRPKDGSRRFSWPRRNGGRARREMRSCRSTRVRRAQIPRQR